MSLVIQPDIVDKSRRRAAIERLRDARVRLPTWSELADPTQIKASEIEQLKRVDPDARVGLDLDLGARHRPLLLVSGLRILRPV